VTRFVAAMAACVAIGSSSTLAAQVGYPPAKSPFIDVEKTHELTPIGGYFSAKRDPAKIAPQSGEMGGLQYEWRATGPLHLGASVMAVKSRRTYLDPALPPDSGRNLGDTRQTLYGADAFLALSLTGARSWHSLMPMVGAGVGVITDTKKADVGGFKFGTRFALPVSAGIRWVPGRGRVQVRADVKDWMYTIVYPQSYYLPASATAPPILESGTPTSRWTHNFAMTVGVSIGLSR
jgi:hypothetical protein